ncbi:MAG: phosphoadenylyl-sulfate reductase [Pseudomonadota bacterium]
MGSADTAALTAAEVERLALELERAEPAEIVARALARFGRELTIAFSGAEDVVLIDLAVKSGHPFSVFTLDTGRLHPETYRYIDRVRQHFGIEIQVVFPDPARVEPFVRQKGLFSFYVDGHSECCAIRKVEPLGRTLAGHRSWMSGQRRDQSPTRNDVRVVELDTRHAGANGPLVKWNPLARATLADVWKHIREHDLPYNELHDRGFVSIGCEPCTRAVRPGEHERAGRWWWEEATRRECGLHVPTKRN